MIERLAIRDASGEARLTPHLVHALAAGLRGATGRRVLVLEGNGRDFCEGLDLGVAAQKDTSWFDVLAEVLMLLSGGPLPTVAVVDGAALGGGLGLAAACDLVIASPRARFALPETMMGLIPCAIFPYVARRVGLARAKLLALTATPITAQEALRWGLVDEIAEDLEAALAARVKRIRRNDPGALSELKRLAALFALPSDYHETASGMFQAQLASAPTQERLRRFLDGQTPWPDEPSA